MLSSLDSLKTFLGICASDKDGVLNQLLRGVSAAVESYLHRTFASATYTEYYDGSGQRDLITRHRPIISVTSLSLDAGGYYGDGASAFGSSTLLTAGSDYVIKRDDGAFGKSGRIRRLGGGTSSNWPDYCGSGSGYLGYRQGPVWPVGSGNIKLVYVAGYAAGTIPAEIELAVNQIAKWVYLTRSNVGPLQHERLGEYDYQVMALQGMMALPELGSARQLLAPWKELVI